MQENTSPYLTPIKTPQEEMNNALRLLDIERRSRRESYALLNHYNPASKKRKIGRVLFFPIGDLKDDVEPTSYSTGGKRTESPTVNENIDDERYVRRLPPLKRRDNVLNLESVGRTFGQSFDEANPGTNL